MIRLEQIQLLERKIDKAVEVIGILKKENQALKNTLDKSQVRMAELENLLEQFKGEQNKIEARIMSALSKLDHLEDDVLEEPPAETPDSVPEAATGEEEPPAPVQAEEPAAVKREAETSPAQTVTPDESDKPEEVDSPQPDPEEPSGEIELDIF